MTMSFPAEKVIAIMKDNKVLFFKAAVVITSVAALYYPDLALIFGNALEFTTGNITNYVITIPLMSAFIIYRKRNILRAVALHREGNRLDRVRIDDVLGITLCVLAVIIYLGGSATLYALEYHVLSLPIFLAGGTVLVFNMQTLRHAIVAILLTLYIQPPPGQLVSELAADLSWTSAVMVEGLLGSLGLPISLDSSFGAPALVMENVEGNRIPFFVGEPSSGVFSTIGLSLFAVFVAYIIRGPTWKRILLFISGFPLFFLLNTLRIAMVLTLWHFWGHDVSEAYHTISGSSMVAIGTLIILLAGEKVLKLNLRKSSVRTVQCNMCAKCITMNESMCISCGRTLGKIRQIVGKSSERIAFIFFLALVTTFLVVTGMYGSLDSRKLSNLDIVMVEGPETTEYLLPQVSGWDLRYAYRDNRVESILNQDAALAFRYVPTNQLENPQGGTVVATNPSIYASVQISTGHHVWEDSLVTYPSRVGRPGATLLGSEDIEISDGKEGRFLLFKRIGSTSTEAVVYWFERTPLKFGGDYENRNVLISIWANTNALASTGMINAPDDSIGIKELYLTLARPISTYWDEQSMGLSSSNELLYAFVSKNLLGLMIITVIPLGLFSIHHKTKKASFSARLHKLYNQMVFEDKSFIKALASSPSNGQRSTGDYIRKSYARIANKELSDDQFTNILQAVRRTGLVTDTIASINDESLLVWKINFRLRTDNSESLVSYLERIQSITRFFRLQANITNDRDTMKFD
jgi:exosortase/archaeosortase family protein